MKNIFLLGTIALLFNCSQRINFVSKHELTIGFTKNNLSKKEQNRINKSVLERLDLFKINYRSSMTDTSIVILLDSTATGNLISKALLNKTKIEFWDTYKNHEVGDSIFNNVNKKINKKLYPIPLDSLLMPYTDSDNIWVESPIIGYCRLSDTAIVNRYLSNEYVLEAININNLKFMWESFSQPNNKNETQFINLYLLKRAKNKDYLLNGSEIISAEYGVNQSLNNSMVSVDFSESGKEIWGIITEKSYRDNSAIAIVINNYVYSAPKASARINSGKTQITGGYFSSKDAKRKAEVLSNNLNFINLPEEIYVISIEDINDK